MGIRGASLVVKFILTLFIAKFLGFEDLGAYGLISAAGIMAPSLVGFGIMVIYVRRAVTQTPEEIVYALRHYGRALFLTYLSLLCIALCAGTLKDALLLSALIWCIVLFEHISSDLYLLLLNLSKPLTANILHFIRTAGWMLIYMALAFAFPSLRTLDALLIGWIIGSAAALAGFALTTRNWPWRNKTPLQPLARWFRTEFRESRLMYANGFLTTISQYINTFLVSFFLGLELTGVFVFFMQVISAMSNLIQTGVIQFARPKMVRAYRERTPALFRFHDRCLLHTGLTATAMAAVAIPAMYVLTFYIVDKPLAIEWFPVFFFLLGGFVVTQITHAIDLIFYSVHRDDITIRLTLLGSLVSFPAKIVFIALFGLWGAAVVECTVPPALLTINIRYALKVRKEFHRDLNSKTDTGKQFETRE